MGVFMIHEHTHIESKTPAERLQMNVWVSAHESGASPNHPHFNASDCSKLFFLGAGRSTLCLLVSVN